MIAASLPVQRPSNAKLLVVDSRGKTANRARSEFVSLLRPGDVVVANDAATLPASLSGRHGPSGRRIEVRLAGRDSLDGVRQFSAVAFGEGDFRTRTEDRPAPPTLNSGDRLELGPLRGTIARLLNHPRFVLLRFDGSAQEIWEGLARHGRPIQYAHVPVPLALWDTWTPIAGPPVAFEAPSAGFVLDWNMLAAMSVRGIRFGTITHAAGISSTGDSELDALLPFDEPYRIPVSTALMIRRAQVQGGRIIAIGTTVVRALEHAAAMFDGVVPAGERLATQRIGACSRIRIVDAILSGTHERGSSHYEMLRAFVPDKTLARIDRELNAYEYRTHEFGDSVFIERAESQRRSAGQQREFFLSGNTFSYGAL
ncbi:MAG: S-adenosylmethionine:tRNA ribosyltransferase-isomerase [Acidobacteriaceae bacterium]|nr:S-adenosylmethionine:tRNA ribosyltransferase-isomerase [Acidobacteriaceae bacterium]